MLASSTDQARCTTASHEALKLDNARWLELAWRGLQHVCEGEALELRNCKCGSTLAREVRL